MCITFTLNLEHQHLLDTEKCRMHGINQESRQTNTMGHGYWELMGNKKNHKFYSYGKGG